MLHQTWFIANTLSDVLIASAMIYYVSSFWCSGSLEADFSTPIPQLRRIWAESGFPKNHVLVNIVRLTVETNLATGKDIQGVDVMMRFPCLTLVQPLSVSYH